MAKKAKKVKAKNVEKEVLVDVVDDEAEAAPPPAVAAEPVMKCVDKGITRYYTKSEYDEKFGKKS